MTVPEQWRNNQTIFSLQKEKANIAFDKQNYSMLYESKSKYIPPKNS